MDRYVNLPVQIAFPHDICHDSFKHFDNFKLLRTFSQGSWDIIALQFPCCVVLQLLPNLIEDNMCDQFRDDRPGITPPSVGPWVLQGENIGFYSRFFMIHLASGIELLRKCNSVHG